MAQHSMGKKLHAPSKQRPGLSTVLHVSTQLLQHLHLASAYQIAILLIESLVTHVARGKLHSTKQRVWYVLAFLQVVLTKRCRGWRLDWNNTSLGLFIG